MTAATEREVTRWTQVGTTLGFIVLAAMIGSSGVRSRARLAKLGVATAGAVGGVR
jgi:hypothetical protein